MNGFAWRGVFMLLGVLASPSLALAQSPPCPIPDDLALHDIALPLAHAAFAAKHLTVLVVGGAASAGTAAGGSAYTMAARLQVRLREQLPGSEIEAVTRAVPRRTASVTVDSIETDLAQTGARLVIWGVGDPEAGSGAGVDALGDTVSEGIDKIHAAGADVILMDLQFAPSIARVVDLEPYRAVVMRVGQDADVPVLDRYELMRSWSDDGVLDFDTTVPAERVQVARQLFDCVAAALADGIATALR
jgi:hypothetical protein